MTAVSIGCAVVAALLFAVSAALQQSVARTASLAAPASGPLRWLPALALLRGLARGRAWVAMAAGCCFCGPAVRVVVIRAALPHLSWAIVGLALSTGSGGLLVQDAFASGSLPTALTSMTVTDPVLSYLAGVALFRAT